MYGRPMANPRQVVLRTVIPCSSGAPRDAALSTRTVLSLRVNKLADLEDTT